MIDRRSATDEWEWTPIDRPGCQGVDGRVLFAGAGLTVVMLRFATDATIDLHAAPHSIDVVCLEGSGTVQVGEETAPVTEGHTFRWPAGVPHRLSTNSAPMLAMLLEHVGRGGGLQ